VTKREVVKATASLYDPLGFIAPVHVKAKMFIQKLWKDQFDWDSPLPSELNQEWVNLHNELASISTTSIPRRYFSSMPDPEDSYQLHVFCDASSKAYGAIVYLRNTRSQETALVMSKSRLTPISNPLTIPRAELMAALLGSRLIDFVYTSLAQQLTISNCTLWSDSQIVLHWLQSDKKLPCFVNNRVTEIKANPVISEFKYCPTADNPADLISRGLDASKLSGNTLWWHGPHWLKLGDWPICETFDSKILQISAEDTCDCGTCDATAEPVPSVSMVSHDVNPSVSHVIDTSRFHSLRKLLRVTAYVRRFIHNMKASRDTRNQQTLSASEIGEAEYLWIRNVQSQAYSTELRALKTKAKHIGPLARQMRLFIDDDDILRVGGRLHNAPIAYAAKFPILLPPRTHFTELLAIDAHLKVKHSGLQSTITNIRQTYWVTQIRPFVKTLLRKCVICRKVNGKPYRKPIPAPLQTSRLLVAQAFTVTGVDFSGALFVKDTNAKGSPAERKAYICLFTCAVTRAIHLELVTDLSTETFLRAFRRFAARRSLPTKMISDNGSTYLSAAEELKKLFQDGHTSQLMSYRLFSLKSKQQSTTVH
jgi:hypothetical protein